VTRSTDCPSLTSGEDRDDVAGASSGNWARAWHPHASSPQRTRAATTIADQPDRCIGPGPSATPLGSIRSRRAVTLLCPDVVNCIGRSGQDIDDECNGFELALAKPLQWRKLQWRSWG
jgi:hypothetical protein